MIAASNTATSKTTSIWAICSRSVNACQPSPSWPSAASTCVASCSGAGASMIGRSAGGGAIDDRLVDASLVPLVKAAIWIEVAHAVLDERDLTADPAVDVAAVAV